MTGGLVMATVVACAGFSVICGSSPAAAGTMGKIALPEMEKFCEETRGIKNAK